MVLRAQRDVKRAFFALPTLSQLRALLCLALVLVYVTACEAELSAQGLSLVHFP